MAVRRLPESGFSRKTHRIKPSPRVCGWPGPVSWGKPYGQTLKMDVDLRPLGGGLRDETAVQASREVNCSPGRGLPFVGLCEIITATSLVGEGDIPQDLKVCPFTKGTGWKVKQRLQAHLKEVFMCISL